MEYNVATIKILSYFSYRDISQFDDYIISQYMTIIKLFKDQV